jgi:hypothetical protein
MDLLIGAALTTALVGDGFLRTTLGIVIGLIGGVGFALLSHSCFSHPSGFGASGQMTRRDR